MTAADWQPTAADFAKAEAAADAQRIARPSISYWQDAWRRLRKNKAAVASAIVLLLLALAGIFGPLVTPFSL